MGLPLYSCRFPSHLNFDDLGPFIKSSSCMTFDDIFCLFHVLTILQDLMWLFCRSTELSGSGLYVNLLLCDSKGLIKITFVRIRVLMVRLIFLGSTDHRSIWAPAQPFPRSAGCTCLLSFVSPSITLDLSSDLR